MKIFNHPVPASLETIQVIDVPIISNFAAFIFRSFKTSNNVKKDIRFFRFCNHVNFYVELRKCK